MARGKRKPAQPKTVVQGHETVTAHPDGTVVVESPDATKTVKPRQIPDLEAGKKELIQAVKSRCKNMPGPNGPATRKLADELGTKFLAAEPGSPEHEKCYEALRQHINNGVALIAAWTMVNAE